MFLFFIHHASDIWELEHKVAFDGPNKLILVNRGVTDIDVQVDIYSDWKEWVQLRDNAKYLQALRPAGGDELGGGETLGGQFFLLNGWRMRTWEGDHTLNVNQNLRVDQNDPDILTKPSSFVPTLGDHQIQINNNLSQITNVIEVEVSGSAGASGSFDAADRATLNQISSIVSNLPNSGTLSNLTSDVQTIVSSSFIAAASVIAGSTDTIVRTTLSNPDNKFDGMTAIIKDDTGGEARQIEIYSQTSGTLQLYPALSFTPQAGDSVVIIPNTDFRFT